MFAQLQIICYAAEIFKFQQKHKQLILSPFSSC